MHRDHRFLPALSALAALVLFAVSANIVFASLVRASIEFDVRREVLANVSALQFTGFFIASIAGGIAADAFGKKRVLQCGCLLLVLGAATWASARNLTAALIGGFIMGTGGGILESMSSALLTELFPDRRKFYLNLSQVAYCAGAIAGPALMGRLIPRGVSWRWFFAGTAVLGLVLMLLFTVAGFPEQEAQPRRRQCSSSMGLIRLSLLVPCIVIFLYVFAEMGAVTFMVVYLQDGLGAPEQWAIYSISIFWLAMVVGRLACAFIPEGHSYERTIGSLLLLSGLSLLLQVLFRSWLTSIALFALTGLFFAGTWPLIVAMVASRHVERCGTAVGLAVACGSLGCVAAPPILGPRIVSDWPQSAFVISGSCLLVAVLLVIALYAASRGKVSAPGDLQPKTLKDGD